MKTHKVTEGGKEYTVEVYPSGSNYWHFDGRLHREDGPAIEWANGDKEWYLHGEFLTELEFNSRKNKAV